MAVLMGRIAAGETDVLQLSVVESCQDSLGSATQQISFERRMQCEHSVNRQQDDMVFPQQGGLCLTGHFAFWLLFACFPAIETGTDNLYIVMFDETAKRQSEHCRQHLPSPNRVPAIARMDCGKSAELGRNALWRPGGCNGPDMDFSSAAAGMGLVVMLHIAKSPRPDAGLSAVLGRDAFDKPGDC
jgi:hypothetical protein